MFIQFIISQGVQVQAVQAFIIKIHITMLQQKNSSGQFGEQTKMKNLKVFHAIVWGAWMVLTLVSDSDKTKRLYNNLFGEILPYRFFYWYELLFMFGGGLLLLILLINLLPDRFRYFSYVIFELFFISIIVVHLIVFFYGIKSA